MFQQHLAIFHKSRPSADVVPTPMALSDYGFYRNYQELGGKMGGGEAENNWGGGISLLLSPFPTWRRHCRQGFFLSAEHLSGRLNIAADWQSRNFHDSSNWKLCPEVFRALMLIRGPCAKDLFADRLNAQLPQFSVGGRTLLHLPRMLFNRTGRTRGTMSFLPFA